ncbi:hypothetical protein [Pseudolactococcus reticulitermitis]|uniref:DUF3592 domain-containing protein n=1 Tax=Pseudolactococcus reticulitermitis TaxID=2025039 RepID=A0A224WVS9_9LACT|nr:hypothetical protein [Lactococcus reticulitermitis]GAX46478.1 hypothetical protein RsY01_57 [Lactococcus reticulitermitis]GHU39610.1 hypothetical protein FACS1894193_00080 [Bacilli bacterium]
MNKIIQKISRVVLAFFALMLLFVGGMTFQRYLTEHKEVKTMVIGQVVKTPKRGKMVAYTFEGKAYQAAPVANFLKNFGKVGTEIPVYVNHNHPTKIYIRKGATSLLIVALALIGWAMLIVLVLFFEYWFLHKLKDMAREENKNN